jgi:bifunctional DNA-binding transcriptional regulator/antitoxin component of YhaV-PrlF toxin-antitoxin module
VSDKLQELVIDENGRLILPEELRNHLGYTFKIEAKNGKVILRPVPLQ